MVLPSQYLKKEIQQTHVQQYVFMHTETYHIVKCMKDIHMNNSKHVKCTPQCLAPIQLKNIHTEGD